MGFRMATIHSVEQKIIPPFIPKVLCDPIEFGNKKYVCNKQWDNLNAFKKPARLAAIKYQPDDSRSLLSGIQLIF